MMTKKQVLDVFSKRLWPYKAYYKSFRHIDVVSSDENWELYIPLRTHDIRYVPLIALQDLFEALKSKWKVDKNWGVGAHFEDEGEFYVYFRNY